MHPFKMRLVFISVMPKSFRVSSYSNLFSIMICLFLTWRAGSRMLKTGVLLLSSCWKHYGLLMHLEDYKFPQHYKELVYKYLSGIQVNFTKSKLSNIVAM